MPNKNIGLIYCGGLLLSFAYGCTFFLPLYIQSLGGNEAKAGWLFSLIGVGTIISIISCVSLFKRFAAKNIACLGALTYCFGSLGLLIPIFQYAACFLLGCGWGFYYNAAPYIISQYTNQKNRSIFFNYLAAMTVLGSCAAPVIIPYYWNHDINFVAVFILSSCVCILALFFFFCIDNQTIKLNTIQKNILASKKYHGPIIYPLMMVFLGASIVTIILNFQTTFARESGLDYASFYAFYAVSTVAARFIFGKPLARCNQFLLIISLIILMIVSLLGFICAINYPIIYLPTTILFAISYGLLYPSLQAIAVNLTAQESHAEIITYFSLSYFVGLYAFPIIGGFLIVAFGYSNMFLVLGMIAFIDFIFSILLYKKINSTKTFVAEV